MLSLVFILSLLNLSFQSRQVASRPRNLETISPKVLAGVARTFELDVRVRDRSFPTDRMTHFPEWAELQRKLSLYSEKLQQIEDQEGELHTRLSTQMLAMSFLMLGATMVAAVLRIREQRRAAAQKSSQQGTESLATG